MPIGTQLFPASSLPGLAWSVKKTPNYKTLIQQAASGQEARLSLRLNPIWEFELTFEFIWDLPVSGGGVSQLRTLEGFYMNAQGSGLDFLLKLQDLTLNTLDGALAAQVIGTGDGTTTAFQVVRSVGQWQEDVQNLDATSLQVFDNGTLVSGSAYTQLNGVIAFTTPPANTHVITVSGTWYYRVRFSDDDIELENFLFRLYTLQTLKLMQVRT